MNRNIFLRPLVLLMLFMYVADLIVKKFHLYYTLWYADMVMHFFGGVWVGLFFLYIFYKKNKILPSISKVVIFTFLIGLLWEIFEFYTNNFIGGDPFNMGDTLSDLFFDLLGGVVIGWYFSRKLYLKQKIG